MSCECMHTYNSYSVMQQHMFCCAKWSYPVVIIAFVMQDGSSPLMNASVNGHFDVVMALIGAGAEVSLTNMLHIHYYS